MLIINSVKYGGSQACELGLLTACQSKQTTTALFDTLDSYDTKLILVTYIDQSTPFRALTQQEINKLDNYLIMGL